MAKFFVISFLSLRRGADGKAHTKEDHRLLLPDWLLQRRAERRVRQIFRIITYSGAMCSSD